jgi:ATP-dependent DNA ligase
MPELSEFLSGLLADGEETPACELPPLYHKTKTGALVMWKVSVEGPRIIAEYGQVGGAVQKAIKIAEPKNVGRSNETTPEEQAVVEANAMHKYRLDRKYSLTPEEAKEDLMLPMLAKEFPKEKHKLVYPVYLQPKLDGVRCLGFREDGQVRLLSRNGKEWNVPHIKEALSDLPERIVLDGEIYRHGETFQTITSWTKKLRPETGLLEYHCYDCIRLDEDDMPWSQRLALLIETTRSLEKPVVLVETQTAANETEVKEGQARFVELGYEGAIVRTADGVYRFGYRSGSLLKVKNFSDAEFEVIGFENGRGKFENCVIWICHTENGDEFRVTPKGTAEQRKEWLDNAQSYIGQFLKTKYFGLTDGDHPVPRFPVGLGFRDEKDR